MTITVRLEDSGRDNKNKNDNKRYWVYTLSNRMKGNTQDFTYFGPSYGYHYEFPCGLQVHQLDVLLFTLLYNFVFVFTLEQNRI